MTRRDRIRSVEDARILAQRRLPVGLYQMYEGGSGTGVTLRANQAAFEQVMFRPRAAVFARERNLRTRILGFEMSMPVLAGPVGLLRLGHRDGEIGVARAAGSAGIIQVVSTATGYPIEDIIAASSGPIFFQLFFVRGRAGTEPLLERVQRAGCKALVVTVDTAAATERERPYYLRPGLPTGTRLRDFLPYSLDFARHFSWLRDFLLDGRPLVVPMAQNPRGQPMTIYEAMTALYEKTPAWDDFSWIRAIWKGPIIIKGVLTPDDARKAVDVGAQAIVVSNHGGNTLDGTQPTLQVLPEIVRAVGGEIEVLLDSGVRRGTDVVKAVSLGARAVLLGRAYVFPCLASGEAGVKQILEVIRQQIDSTLAFLGCDSIGALDPSYLSWPTEWRSR